MNNGGYPKQVLWQISALDLRSRNNDSSKPILSLINVLSHLFVLIGVLIRVAFFTLLERKVLSYAQIRKGPNKVGFAGILQPFADAIKLLTKEELKLKAGGAIPYWIAPAFSFSVMCFLWGIVPSDFESINHINGVILFLCCIGAGGYGVIFAGWSSNSKYALLGGLRAVAQTISYEVVLALILICLVLLTGSYDLSRFCCEQKIIPLGIIFLPASFMLFISAVIETNRAPFDLSEGESELVRGFNIEYGGTKFALIFLAEYGIIIFISAVLRILLVGGSKLLFIVSTLFFSILFLLLRARMPRVRYDHLINLVWKRYLPAILFLGRYLFLFF